MHYRQAQQGALLDRRIQLSGTQRVLLTGSWSKAYPQMGVRLAFDLLENQVGDLPVVIVHGANHIGVDDTAEKIAYWWGWKTEPHPVDWSRCSPLCEGAEEPHRKKSPRLGDYCPNAGHWNSQRLVDLHHNPNVGPYRLCIALPLYSWGRSDEVEDCYHRAQAAGIETMALNPEGRFFTNPKQRAGKRK